MPLSIVTVYQFSVYVDTAFIFCEISVISRFVLQHRCYLLASLKGLAVCVGLFQDDLLS